MQVGLNKTAEQSGIIVPWLPLLAAACVCSSCRGKIHALACFSCLGILNTNVQFPENFQHCCPGKWGVHMGTPNRPCMAPRTCPVRRALVHISAIQILAGRGAAGVHIATSAACQAANRCNRCTNGVKYAADCPMSEWTDLTIRKA